MKTTSSVGSGNAVFAKELRILKAPTNVDRRKTLPKVTINGKDTRFNTKAPRAGF